MFSSAVEAMDLPECDKGVEKYKFTKEFLMRHLGMKPKVKRRRASAMMYVWLGCLTVALSLEQEYLGVLRLP